MKKDEKTKHSRQALFARFYDAITRVRSIAYALALTAGCSIDVEQPALEHPAVASQTVQLCPAQDLLTTPVAEQCCYSSVLTNDNDGFTMFYNAASNQIVTRVHNPYGLGCRASDGISACNGSECFYGPLGFSRPTFTAPPTTPADPYWTIFAASSGSSTSCEVAGPSALPYDPTFIDKTGINAPGQGCPGDGMSANSADTTESPWDY